MNKVTQKNTYLLCHCSLTQTLLPPLQLIIQRNYKKQCGDYEEFQKKPFAACKSTLVFTLDYYKHRFQSIYLFISSFFSLNSCINCIASTFGKICYFIFTYEQI